MKISKKLMVIGGGIGAAVLAAAGGGYAASLGATANTAAASVATVASCNSGAAQGITISWPAPTDTAATGWNVSTVNVNGIDGDTQNTPNCNGLKVYVDVTNGSSIIATTSASGTAVVGGSGSSFSNLTVSPSLTWSATACSGPCTVANATAVNIAIQ